MSDALERVYERLLLGMAREACEANGSSLNVSISGYVSCLNGRGVLCFGRGPNLADALAALLRDLGVEDVPERVSAEEVREAWERLVVIDTEGEGGDWLDLGAHRALYASGNRGALLAESILAVGSV